MVGSATAPRRSINSRRPIRMVCQYAWSDRSSTPPRRRSASGPAKRGIHPRCGGRTNTGGPCPPQAQAVEGLVVRCGASHPRYYHRPPARHTVPQGYTRAARRLHSPIPLPILKTGQLRTEVLREQCSCAPCQPAGSALSPPRRLPVAPAVPSRSYTGYPLANCLDFAPRFC